MKRVAPVRQADAASLTPIPTVTVPDGTPGDAGRLQPLDISSSANGVVLELFNIWFQTMIHLQKRFRSSSVGLTPDPLLAVTAVVAGATRRWEA